MINEELFVIGATDGTLMFLKLDSKTQSLTVHSVNNTHKGCINEIWTEQSLCTYVASSVSVKMSKGVTFKHVTFDTIYAPT